LFSQRKEYTLEVPVIQRKWTGITFGFSCYQNPLEKDSQEANNEGLGKEASATRVISQPQMLDKSKEAESLLDDIQKGRSDYLEEKSLPIYSFPRFSG